MIIFATKYDDATQNSFSSAQSVVDENDVLLFENEAINQKLVIVLNNLQNENLMCFSHGEPNYWRDNNDEFALSDTEIHLLKNRKIFVYACKTANILGKTVGMYDNAFYWGYNTSISASEMNLKDIFSFIKQNFIHSTKKETIDVFFDNLKNMCEVKAKVIAESYPDSTMEDHKAVRQIWACLELHCNHQIHRHTQYVPKSLY